jgi:hypothetical protein
MFAIEVMKFGSSVLRSPHDLYGFFDGAKEITILGSDWLSGPHSSASLARHHRRRHAAARRERSRESWQSSVMGSELRAAPRLQDLSQTKSFHVQHLDSIRMPYPSKTDRQTILSAAVKQLAHVGIRDLSLRNLAASHFLHCYHGVMRLPIVWM